MLRIDIMVKTIMKIDLARKLKKWQMDNIIICNIPIVVVGIQYKTGL